jgi:hypothetical protein
LLQGGQPGYGVPKRRPLVARADEHCPVGDRHQIAELETALAGPVAQEAAFVEEQPVAVSVDVFGIGRVVADQPTNGGQPISQVDRADGFPVGIDQLGV